MIHDGKRKNAAPSFDDVAITRWCIKCGEAVKTNRREDGFVCRACKQDRAKADAL